MFLSIDTFFLFRISMPYFNLFVNLFNPLKNRYAESEMPTRILIEPLLFLFVTVVKMFTMAAIFQSVVCFIAGF